MPSKYEGLFTELARPFEEWELKRRRGDRDGRELVYVNAQTIMNRLDEVLGPENWSDEYSHLGIAASAS